MKMSVDTFLRIGKQHAMCEDYIISGEDPCPYVILADGCSSSKHTDLGARLLCWSTKFFLETNPVGYLPHESAIADFTIHNVKSIIDLLHMDSSCLDTTLMVSFLYNCAIYVYAYGDGNIITISNDDEVSWYKISYGLNAPDYLSYHIDAHRKQLFENLQGNERKVIKYKLSWDEPLKLHNYYRFFIFPLTDYKSILIASDGIETFLHPETGPIDNKEILRQLVAFKNTNGEFVKRRMKRMVKNYEKSGVQHYDDISIGGFHW